MKEQQLLISRKLESFDFGQMNLQKLKSDATIITQNYRKNLAVGRGFVTKKQNHVFVAPAFLGPDVR